MIRHDYSEERLRDAIKANNTYNDVLRALGIPINGNYLDTLKKYIKKYNIDVSHIIVRKRDNHTLYIPSNDYKKECPRCKRILSADKFSFINKQHTRLSSWCRDCQKEKTKEIRAANIEKYKKRDNEKHSEYYQRKRDILNSYKTGGCIICGEKEPVCLDFHHKNPATKSFDVGKNFHLKPFPIIEEEIKKCTVLCANCHRKVHAGIIKL